MVDQPVKEWLLNVGKTGTSCEVFCNGVKLLNVQAADLHLEAGEATTLNLRLAGYAPREGDTTPDFRQGDAVTAEGTPMVTSFEIGGQTFEVLNTQGKTWLARRLHALIDRWDEIGIDDKLGATFYMDAARQLERVLERNGIERQENVHLTQELQTPKDVAPVTEVDVANTLSAGPGPLESFIRLAMIDDQTAILRKYYRDTTTGRIQCKYGLTRQGAWVLIEEGAEAPEECQITPGY